MPTFTTRYAPPGAYVKFLRENLSPNLIAGYRVPVFIGTGITSKTVQTRITRGATDKDNIPVPAVIEILRVGNTDASEDYREGVDYQLGAGPDANRIIWTTPGTVVSGIFTINDLDFGNLSTSMTAQKVGQLVNDSYVVEVTSSGAGNTRAKFFADNAVSNNLSVSETISVDIDGTEFLVALASGDTRATVLSKFQTSIGNAAEVSLDLSNRLNIISNTQGATSSILITVASNTLKIELGISDGVNNTFTYEAGTNGTGQVSITARSSRETNLYQVGELSITDIPGLELTILSTASHPIGQKAEIVTEADVIAKNPSEGADYFIRVRSQKQIGDYELKYFTREEEDVFYQIYGDPDPENTLSLAAWVAFRNLTDIIGVVQLQGTDDLPHFQQAIDKLIDKPIYYVVPLTSDPQVHAYVKFHVEQQSDILQRRERMGFVGGAAGYSLFDHTDSAKALNSERMVWVAPSSWEVQYLDSANFTHVANVDGSYGAVAVSSIAAVRDPATPLTRKQITSLKPLVVYNPTQQNILATDGVLVVETFGGVSRVRHQLTTYAKGPIESKEISIVQLRDHVSVILRNNLEDEFPGQKILRTTPKVIETFVERILEGLMAQEIITGFQNVKAVQNDVDPTQIDVFFEASPVYPLNYVLVTFKFVRQAQVANV